MNIDGRDFGLLLGMYDDAPTMTELGINNRKRVYRLSRANLCMCDRPGTHPGQPRCWSLTPAGTSLVESVDEEYGNLWRLRGWEIDWKARDRHEGLSVLRGDKMGEQYEVIKYRQSPDTTERNAETIARALGDNDRQRAEFPDFWVWCLDCDHTWEIEGEAWGYAKCCPQCGSWETRS